MDSLNPSFSNDLPHEKRKGYLQVAWQPNKKPNNFKNYWDKQRHTQTNVQTLLFERNLEPPSSPIQTITVGFGLAPNPAH